MKRLSTVARFAVGLFTLAFVFLLLIYTGRTSVLLLGLASLVALSVLKRTQPLWIAPMWGVALPLGVALTLVPFDVKFSNDFPAGLWVRPYTYGLLYEPVPRDATGVPEFYWTGSCITYGNEPDQVLVVGLGGKREAMADAYGYSATDAEVQDKIREAMYAYESHFAEHGTFAGLDLTGSEYFEPADRVTLEHTGNDDFYVIRGSHCESPHVFEVTLEYEHPEAGKVRRVEWRIRSWVNRC